MLLPRPYSSDDGGAGSAHRFPGRANEFRYRSARVEVSKYRVEPGFYEIQSAGFYDIRARGLRPIAFP